MSDWLEIAEHKKDQTESRSAFKKRLVEKKFMVNKNFEANGKAYEAFISNLLDLTKRANNLPEEEREPYGKINSKTKKNSLNNHYYFFGSSKRAEKRELDKGFRKLWKKSHYKYIRVIYFTVSSHNELADIEIKERSMKRHKMHADDDKKKSGSSQKVSRIFRYRIEDMNSELAREVLDWLPFHKDKEKLSFFKNEFSIR